MKWDDQMPTKNIIVQSPQVAELFNFFSLTLSIPAIPKLRVYTPHGSSQFLCSTILPSTLNVLPALSPPNTISVGPAMDNSITSKHKSLGVSFTPPISALKSASSPKHTDLLKSKPVQGIERAFSQYMWWLAFLGCQ